VSARYRRRTGLIYRRGNIGGQEDALPQPPILDGGRDAPFGPRDSNLFKLLGAAVVVIGIALVVVALLDG